MAGEEASSTPWSSNFEVAEVPQPSTPNEQPTQTTQPPPADVVPPQTSQFGPITEDRSELLSRARGFLTSPQIYAQDLHAKRRFLAEKGLRDTEIDTLLRELPHQAPIVPPRTYPPVPPSALPNLIIGLLRVFSWVLGGSAALIFLYHRFLLPRIARTFIARQSLKTHHLSLIRKLTTDLAVLKEAQSESYSILPRPEPFKEPEEFSTCTSIDAVLAINSSPDKIPPITLLRCAIADFSKLHREESPSTEELFQVMEAKFPSLTTPEGSAVESNLWEALTTCPLFEGKPEENSSNSVPRQTHWTYNPPEIPAPTPLKDSLQALSAAMPKRPKGPLPSSAAQNTLQTLSNLTGYISTQVYLPYRPPGHSLGPAEDEMRREIRALKGLVLNRRSFMPSLQRTNTYS
ncbi:hypothetical protein BDN71DRAFT_1421783 [Pleurotus eryngii]|uniref:Peroxisome membrane anchor protein Pex14p N-terminal domain-containing protein n=1 Tax=Pleurotus eryngii TaxID=5323 RepID=A0A9P5ZPR7_PLEER|nr:hypothetical protein BDN71DRAFT_1421783 [Pleurotus eryngii]